MPKGKKQDKLHFCVSHAVLWRDEWEYSPEVSFWQTEDM
jgi:hypothetical protein